MKLHAIDPFMSFCAMTQMPTSIICFSKDEVGFMRVCVCVCVCARARACVRRACVSKSSTAQSVGDDEPLRSSTDMF